MVTTSTVRVTVSVVCGLCVGGMIVATILHHDGLAVTFGLVAAVAVICMMVATAVTREPAGAEDLARRVEARVTDLAAAGVEETALRSLVRDAVALGKARG